MSSSTIDFVGIGATKAGSSWLSDMLAAHPQVCLSEPKEIRYFNVAVAPGHSEPNPNANKDLDWYHSHFRHCPVNAVRGEYTPMYMADSEAIDRLMAYNPELKLIVCLRDPIDRLVSHYLMNRDYVGITRGSLADEIESDPRYLKQGLYGEQLEYLYSRCKPEQLLVLFTDELKADREGVLQRLYSFVGVDPTYRPPTMNRSSNEAKRARFPWVGKFINSLPRLMVRLHMNWILTALRKANIHNLILALLTRKTDASDNAAILEPTLRTKLQGYYRKDINKLSAITGRDLSHWLRETGQQPMAPTLEPD